MRRGWSGRRLPPEQRGPLTVGWSPSPAPAAAVTGHGLPWAPLPGRAASDLPWKVLQGKLEERQHL